MEVRTGAFAYCFPACCCFLPFLSHVVVRFSGDYGPMWSGRSSGWCGCDAVGPGATTTGIKSMESHGEPREATGSHRARQRRRKRLIKDPKSTIRGVPPSIPAASPCQSLTLSAAPLALDPSRVCRYADPIWSGSWLPAAVAAAVAWQVDSLRRQGWVGLRCG
ncbi:hypothetical protein BGZ61DRAFT_44751 [Ilyonectria robusta]|uniref:uncharacterized protein n=1 Tax=Ilyonectria robusta TaxID=1079257 RepID=UPI001E8E73C2|nr:uncharacterized protein BGZ61DRAFT_44751 [Ilyonectria robusta]KAH8686723.1 hypothetical protein BGZ61DRAFT_44751 [Ilyonectria robusta]